MKGKKRRIYAAKAIDSGRAAGSLTARHPLGWRQSTGNQPSGVPLSMDRGINQSGDRGERRIRDKLCVPPLDARYRGGPPPHPPHPLNPRSPCGPNRKLISRGGNWGGSVGAPSAALRVGEIIACPPPASVMLFVPPGVRCAPLCAGGFGAPAGARGFSLRASGGGGASARSGLPACWRAAAPVRPLRPASRSASVPRARPRSRARVGVLSGWRPSSAVARSRAACRRVARGRGLAAPRCVAALAPAGKARGRVAAILY